jgi:hypothetical protein
MRRPAPEAEATELYVYSEEDIAGIASDMYVDLREVMDDDQAAEAVDICFERLTDGYYSHK